MKYGKLEGESGQEEIIYGLYVPVCSRQPFPAIVDGSYGNPCIRGGGSIFKPASNREINFYFLLYQT